MHDINIKPFFFNYIQNCENCFFLFSACSSSIQILNCKKIDVISASSHVKLVNITNGSFYLYTCSPTDIESCRNISLGNFFIQLITWNVS